MQPTPSRPADLISLVVTPPSRPFATSLRGGPLQLTRSPLPVVLYVQALLSHGDPLDVLQGLSSGDRPILSLGPTTGTLALTDLNNAIGPLVPGFCDSPPASRAGLLRAAHAHHNAASDRRASDSFPRPSAGTSSFHVPSGSQSPRFSKKKNGTALPPTLALSAFWMISSFTPVSAPLSLRC
jgi:hypothetical protein